MSNNITKKSVSYNYDMHSTLPTQSYDTTTLNSSESLISDSNASSSDFSSEIFLNPKSFFDCPEKTDLLFSAIQKYGVERFLNEFVFQEEGLKERGFKMVLNEEFSCWKPVGGEVESYHWIDNFQVFFNGVANEKDDALLSLTDVCLGFTKSAELYGRIIIDEINVPNYRKKIKAIDAGGMAGGTKFRENGIFFKLAGDVQFRNGNWMYGNKSSSLYLANKAMGNELKGTNVLLQMIEQLNIQNEMIVPLTSVIDYLGFRVCAFSFLPVNDNSLIHGTRDAGASIILPTDPTLEFDSIKLNHHYSNIEALANSLFLDKHSIFDKSSGQVKTIQFAADVEFHMHEEECIILDLARILPPSDQRLPLVKQFRPEFLNIYSQRVRDPKLSPDTFTGFGIQDRRIHEKKLKRAINHLYEKSIPNAVFYYHTHPNMSVKDIMHKNGVNLSLLGKVRELQTSNTNHNDVFLLEMVARTLKNKLDGELNMMHQQKLPNFEIQNLLKEILSYVLTTNSNFWKLNPGKHNLEPERIPMKSLLLSKYGQNCLTELEKRNSFNLTDSFDFAQLKKSFFKYTGIRISSYSVSPRLKTLDIVQETLDEMLVKNLITDFIECDKEHRKIVILEDIINFNGNLKIRDLSNLINVVQKEPNEHIVDLLIQIISLGLSELNLKCFVESNGVQFIRENLKSIFPSRIDSALFMILKFDELVFQDDVADFINLLDNININVAQVFAILRKYILNIYDALPSTTKQMSVSGFLTVVSSFFTKQSPTVTLQALALVSNILVYEPFQTIAIELSLHTEILQILGDENQSLVHTALIGLMNMTSTRGNFFSSNLLIRAMDTLKKSNSNVVKMACSKFMFNLLLNGNGSYVETFCERNFYSTTLEVIYTTPSAELRSSCLDLLRIFTKEEEKDTCVLENHLEGIMTKTLDNIDIEGHNGIAYTEVEIICVNYCRLMKLLLEKRPLLVLESSGAIFTSLETMANSLKDRVFPKIQCWNWILKVIELLYKTISENESFVHINVGFQTLSSVLIACELDCSKEDKLRKPISSILKQHLDLLPNPQLNNLCKSVLDFLSNCLQYVFETYHAVNTHEEKHVALEDIEDIIYLLFCIFTKATFEPTVENMKVASRILQSIAKNIYFVNDVYQRMLMQCYQEVIVCFGFASDISKSVIQSLLRIIKYSPDHTEELGNLLNNFQVLILEILKEICQEGYSHQFFYEEFGVDILYHIHQVNYFDEVEEAISDIFYETATRSQFVRIELDKLDILEAIGLDLDGNILDDSDSG